MTPRARRLRRAALTSGLLVLVHAAVVLRAPHRAAQIAGEVAVFAGAALSAWWCLGIARRQEVRHTPVATLFGLAFLAWSAAGLVWVWYEGWLGVTVASSTYDLLYTSGGLLMIAAVLVRLALTLDRNAAVRSLLDGLLVGSSLFFIVWALVGDDLGRDLATWRYPAIDVVAATLSVLVVSRVPVRSRAAWLVISAAFLALAVADCSWAWGNMDGAFTLGNPPDPLWPLGYTAIGLCNLLTAVHQETHDSSGGQVRIVAARWEVLLPYGPVAVAFGVGLWEHVTGDGFRGDLVSGALAIVTLLIVRHVFAILENHHMARDLEQRVADRTEELRSREEHFRSVVQGISDLVVVLDPESRVSYHSPTAHRMLGIEEDERLLDRNAMRFVHPSDHGLAAELVAAVGDVPGATVTGELRIKGGDSWWPADVVITNLLDHPAVGGLVITVRDIRERKELEERLRHQAFHDPLTGLANRARLHACLDALVAAGRRPGLVLLDLDEFKAVNDTSGHELGDEVLVAVAARLLRCTRPGDVVARLGGDEFAVLIDDDVPFAAARAVADRVLDALSRPVDVRGRQVRCGASLGVALVRDDGDGTQVLRDADVAMYVAKANGKHRYEVFTDAMHDDVVRRRRLEDHLREAVAAGDLVLHYQPLVDLADRSVVGVEALVRLPDGEGGLVPPLDFVPMAEETGLIVPLGAWVLRTACRQAADWQALRPDGPPVQVSVNVSVRQLQDPGLCDQVALALEHADLPPQLLTLEITEGALGEDAGAGAALRTLRALGVRLSIDDFGAGYSSLGRLRDFPVDELKIDRSFVREIQGDGPAPLVAAVLSMARSLGLDVVAEGIEHVDQAAHLARRGCRIGQGFLFARPMAADELTALLRGDLPMKDSTSVHQLL